MLAIVVFFGGLTAWSIQRATTRVSRVSDPGYYARGLGLDRDAAAARAARAEGWTLNATVRQGELRVRLVDRAGNPVTGVEASLTLSTSPGGDSRLQLIEGKPGEYTAPLPEGIHWPVSAHLELQRDGARMVRPLLLNP